MLKKEVFLQKNRILFLFVFLIFSTYYYNIDNNFIMAQNNEISKIENNEISKIENNEISKIENNEISKIENNEISKIENNEISKIENNEILRIENNEISKVKPEVKYLLFLYKDIFEQISIKNKSQMIDFLKQYGGLEQSEDAKIKYSQIYFDKYINEYPNLISVILQHIIQNMSQLNLMLFKNDTTAESKEAIDLITQTLLGYIIEKQENAYDRTRINFSKLLAILTSDDIDINVIFSDSLKIFGVLIYQCFQQLNYRYLDLLHLMELESTGMIADFLLL
ncbi:MAG: putative secreted protein [Candidatus Phytoplasma cynodontis]|nr:MAG: putative secreted protein [Candidatus Phytoplasma cynodontis]